MPDLAVWPTDGAGPGGDGSVSSEARWRKMGRLWVPSGVEDSPLGVGGGFGSLAPTLVAGPTINVAIGSAWLDGHYAELTAPASVPATANGLLVVRFTPADNHAELLYRDAATAPTQTATTWELAIAQMTAGAIADRRQFARYGGIYPTPACILRTTSGVSYPNGTSLMLWNASNSSEVVDTHNMHDPAVNPSRITIPVRGVYGLALNHLGWGASTAGTYRYLKIQNQSAAVLVSSRIPVQAAMAGTATNADQSVYTEYIFAAGEYVEGVVIQDSGAALTLTGAQFAVSYRGPAPYGAGM